MDTKLAWIISNASFYRTYTAIFPRFKFVITYHDTDNEWTVLYIGMGEFTGYDIDEIREFNNALKLVVEDFEVIKNG